MKTDHKTASRKVESNSANTRFTGAFLIIARIVWLAIVLPSVILFVASLPVFYAHIQQLCVDVITCNISGTLTAKGLHSLPALGLSVSGYAVFVTVFYTILVAIWSGIGLLIFMRRSDERFALVTAFLLVMVDITYSGSPIYALTRIKIRCNVAEKYRVVLLSW